MRRPILLLFFMNILRVGMGVFFLVTGLLKVSQLDQTAEFLTRSRLLPSVCSMPLACVGVGMEIVVGFCLLFRLVYRGSTLWGCVMSGTFLLLYAQAWVRGLELSCNCMGARHLIVNYPLDTGLRLLLFSALLILVWDSRHASSLLHKGKFFDFSEV